MDIKGYHLRGGTWKQETETSDLNCHLSLRLEYDSVVDHGISRWLKGQWYCWLIDDPNTGQWLKVKREIWNELSVFPLLGEVPTKRRLSWSWKGPCLPETSRYSAWNTDGGPHVTCTRCKDYKSCCKLLSKMQANPHDECVFQWVLRSSVHKDLCWNVWVALEKLLSFLSSRQASSMSHVAEVSKALRGRSACMFKPPSSFSLRVALKPSLGPGHVLPTARVHSPIPTLEAGSIRKIWIRNSEALCVT